MVEINNITDYVDEHKGENKIIYAEKKGAIEINRVTSEHDIEVYSESGHETTEHAKIGDLVAIMLNDDYSRYILNNINSAYNTWIISPSTLKDKYELKMKNSPYSKTPLDNCVIEGVYVPKGGEQRFMQIYEDIEFEAPWGEFQKIYSGGFLNITDVHDIYGINPEEFKKTYIIK